MNCNIVGDYLKRKNKLPDNFRFWKYEVFPHPPAEGRRIVIFTGGECQTITRGPRKGEPNYRKAINRRAFSVGIDEGDEIEIAWEKETGKCRNCAGRGTTGWPEKPCRRCNGTGKIQEQGND